ncbi:hypothetical protein AV530_003026 [Patagioenas fasciata monilis]|uniref:Uncharacterized protein n=1 Tax=Patagioenas fasciata monilis TaxID=372326 RepID=A0A1V4KVK7_PATFA|nr:hypothetical protein AV530_003026 [Patagioenas fasciata monilis]
MKLVNVRAIDTLFSDVAEAFNEQHGDHSDMLRAARGLREGKQVPEKLKRVQRHMGELSRSTKRVLARTTTLREMICSVLRSQTELEERIKTANPEYLDQVRLESNLRENMQKLSLAKELSEQYDGAARSVLREMAKLAGSVLERAPETGAE